VSDAGVPTRSQFAAAASIAAALIAYASLGPFRIHVSLPMAWHVLSTTWPPVIGSKTDFISNVILQMPLGFLIAGAVGLDRPGRRALALTVAVLLGGGLALAIEIAQVYVPSRTPQFIDVVAETIGAFVGAIAWVIVGNPLVRVFRPWWRARGSLTLACLMIYVAAWTLWQWVPFDFTLRRSEVAGKYHLGMIVAFPRHVTLGSFVVRVLAAALLAAPVGIAANHAFGTRGSKALPAAIAVMWVLGVATGQLLVLSRSTTLALFAVAAAGSVAGVHLTKWRRSS
jgi:VanZ family protein